METYGPFPLHCMKVRGGTQFRCTTRQDLINLESILLENQVPFRFLPDLRVKKFKVVIRGLDQKIDPHMIQQDLADLGFRALRVVLMHSFKTRLPLPMFLVELEDNAAARDVLKLKSLLYFKVVVEDYRGRKLPPQCSRCQHYYHTAGSSRPPPPLVVSVHQST